jgi:choloylglycine hydrolase
LGDSNKMNKKIIGVCVMMLLIGPAVLSVSACTGFTASDDEKVLVGCNFDWSHDFNAYINFLPAEDGKYGRVLFDIYWPWFGDPEGYLPIQGMNDQGLFYDTYLTPYLLPVNSNDKPVFSSEDSDYKKYGWMGILPYCLAECSTVSEVLEVINQYNLKDWTEGQVFFVDKNGDSLIAEGDDIIFKEGDFQVVTNFLQSHPELGGHPCSRYNTAVSMLENMTELSVNYFKSICNATHDSNSVFSNIYDLKQEIVYVHYYYDYENTVEFDLNQELAKGKNRIYLGSLFEPENNQPPEKPDAPTGEISGLPGDDFDYRASETIDPDNDLIMYLFNWGDGTNSEWIMPSRFGSIKATHNWTERGDYEVRVKAMDQYGAESDWSDPLVVSMPKNKTINDFNPWLLRLIQRFPILEILLQTC